MTRSSMSTSTPATDVTPVRPVLFVGIGRLAVQTLALLPDVERDMGVRVAGPFP